MKIKKQIHRLTLAISLLVPAGVLASVGLYQHVQGISYAKNVSVKEVEALAGDKLKLNIALSPDINVKKAEKTWLRIFGLPKELKFSTGALINDVWFISPENFSKLYLVSPESYQGQFTLDFYFMMQRDSNVSIIGKQKIGVKITSPLRNS